MIVKCNKCGKEWDYTGDNKTFCTCPDCRALVKIPKSDGE